MGGSEEVTKLAGICKFSLCSTVFTHDIVAWLFNFSILKARAMNDIPVIYFVPKLSKFITLYLWDQCNLESVIMQTVPYNIYNYFRTGNMGIFEKVLDSFSKVSKRM